MTSLASSVMNLKVVTTLTMLVGALSAAVLLGWVPRLPTVIFVGIALVVLFGMNISYLRKGWGILETYPNRRYRALLLTMEALCIAMALGALMS